MTSGRIDALRANFENPDDRLARLFGPPLDEASNAGRVTAGSSELLAVQPGPYRERSGSNVEGGTATALREPVENVHDGVLLKIATIAHEAGRCQKDGTIRDRAERDLRQT